MVNSRRAKHLRVTRFFLYWRNFNHNGKTFLGTTNMNKCTTHYRPALGTWRNGTKPRIIHQFILFRMVRTGVPFVWYVYAQSLIYSSSQSCTKVDVCECCMGTRICWNGNGASVENSKLFFSFISKANSDVVVPHLSCKIPCTEENGYSIIKGIF